MEWILSLGEWLLAHPGWSAVVYVLAFAVIMAIGIPGGMALMLCGGFLFGWWWGAWLSTLGGLLAAAVTYALIQTAFGTWLDHRAAPFRSSVQQFLGRGNTILLVLPRLIPGLPFFALNAAMTVSGVPLGTYLWTIAVGLLPIAMLFCSIGAELRDLSEISQDSVRDLLLSPGVFIPIALLAGLTVLGWLFLRRRRSA